MASSYILVNINQLINIKNVMNMRTEKIIFLSVWHNTKHAPYRTRTALRETGASKRFLNLFWMVTLAKLGRSRCFMSFYCFYYNKRNLIDHLRVVPMLRPSTVSAILRFLSGGRPTSLPERLHLRLVVSESCSLCARFATSLELYAKTVSLNQD